MEAHWQTATTEWIWTSFVEDPVPKYFYYSPLFPSPIVCLRDITVTGSKEVYNRLLPWNGIGAWVMETSGGMLALGGYVDVGVLLLSAIVGVVLTLLRILLDEIFFKRLAEFFGLEKNAGHKIGESIWKITIYSITWVWSAYLVFGGQEEYFFAMRTHYQWWYQGSPIPFNPYCLIVFEMGFYVHSVYATLYLDVVKKDYYVMLMHHFLAYLLLLSAYATRLYVHALLILFLMDLGDVLLELSKLLFHCRYRRGRYCRIMGQAANITFAAFTLQFILFRIYWYPTKVLYSTFHTVIEMYPTPPNYFYLNMTVSAIYSMQVYWLKFIFLLLWKVLVKGEEPQDTRDLNKEQALTKLHHNGTIRIKHE